MRENLIPHELTVFTGLINPAVSHQHADMLWRLMIKQIHGYKGKSSLRKSQHKELPIRCTSVYVIREGALRQNNSKCHQPAEGKDSSSKDTAGNCLFHGFEPARCGQTGCKKYNNKICGYRIKRHISAETDEFRDKNDDERQESTAQTAYTG